MTVGGLSATHLKVSTFIVQRFWLSEEALAFLSHCALLKMKSALRSRYTTTPTEKYQVVICNCLCVVLQFTLLQMPKHFCTETTSSA